MPTFRVLLDNGMESLVKADIISQDEQPNIVNFLNKDGDSWEWVGLVRDAVLVCLADDITNAEGDHA